MSGHTVSVNGATLAYDLTGSGPAVVLIGGGGTLDRRMWDKQVAALARRHTVLCYDIRGIGGSSRPESPFSHSEDLHALLHALELAPAVVVGLSFGGAIAIDLALDHPDDVKGLVLVAPGLSNERDENLKPALAAAEFARANGMAALAEMIVNHPGVLVSAPADARARVKAIYLDNADVFGSDYALVRLWQPTVPPAAERISSIDRPTLLLVGDRDSDHVRETVRRLRDTIPDAQEVIVERAGHLLNLDAPDIFDREVTAFLDTIGSPR
jgi:3-oxoadipate enol-lactonase